MTFPNLEKLATSIGFVLVSGSPRRKAILTETGIPFELIVPEIDENNRSDLAPPDLAVDIARRKVESVSKDGRKAYLGCDTIVVYNDMILNKPVDQADALNILKTLSGNTHSVFTGLALYDSRNDVYHQAVEESRVRFNKLDEQKLIDYIATGEPLDKAGAYGIQGMGRFLVDSVEGNIDNVIGLPMGALEQLVIRYWERYA